MATAIEYGDGSPSDRNGRPESGALSSYLMDADQLFTLRLMAHSLANAAHRADASRSWRYPVPFDGFFTAVTPSTGLVTIDQRSRGGYRRTLQIDTDARSIAASPSGYQALSLRQNILYPNVGFQLVHELTIGADPLSDQTARSWSRRLDTPLTQRDLSRPWIDYSSRSKGSYTPRELGDEFSLYMGHVYVHALDQYIPAR